MVIATQSSLNTINWPIEAWLDVHYELVRLLSPSRLEVKREGRRAKNTSLDRLRTYSRPVTDEDFLFFFQRHKIYI